MEEYNSPCISCCKTDDLFSLFEAHSCEGEEIDPAVDLLYRSFDIQLMSKCIYDAICGSCLLKLRDAFMFKSQVLKNAKDLQFQSEYINTEITEEKQEEEFDKILNPETGILETIPNPKFKKQKELTSILKKEPKTGNDSSNQEFEKKEKVKRVSFLEPEISSIRYIPRLAALEDMDCNLDLMDTEPNADDDKVDIECLKQGKDHIESTEQDCNESKCEINAESPKSSLNGNIDTKPTQPSDTCCKICNQKFKSANFLQKHMATHTFDGKCDQCDKTFTNKAAKTRHMLIHSKGPFPCQYCDQIFDKINSRYAHVWRSHKTGTPYVCKECGDRFTTLHKRVQHMKEAHGRMEPNYPCPHCDKRFFHAGSRWQHIRLSHYGERRHTCTECPMKFPKRRDLLNHMAAIHDSVPKRFECHFCSMMFYKATDWRYHLKRHEKAVMSSFKCNQCDSAFPYKALLKCHIKRHELDSAIKKPISENAWVSPVEDTVIVKDEMVDDCNDIVYLEISEE